MKDTVMGKETQAHIFEYATLACIGNKLQLTRRYTSQVMVSETGEVGFGAVPVQFLFCLKESVSWPLGIEVLSSSFQAKQEETKQSSMVLQVSFDSQVSESPRLADNAVHSDPFSSPMSACCLMSVRSRPGLAFTRLATPLIPLVLELIRQLYKCFEKHPNVGGACGEIFADTGQLTVNNATVSS